MTVNCATTVPSSLTVHDAATPSAGGAEVKAAHAAGPVPSKPAPVTETTTPAIPDVGDTTIIGFTVNAARSVAVSAPGVPVTRML